VDDDFGPGFVKDILQRATKKRQGLKRHKEGNVRPRIKKVDGRTRTRRARVIAPGMDKGAVQCTLNHGKVGISLPCSLLSYFEVSNCLDRDEFLGI